MRTLLPEAGDLDPAALADLYDWPSRTWLRAVMVFTLDGGWVGPDGLSGSISSSADQRVFSAIRTYADALLVGATTVRAEGYQAVRARPSAQEARRAAGQLPAPTLAIVSASCRFDWDRAAFLTSDNPPIVLTTERADPVRRAAAADLGCEVLIAGQDRVDLPAALGLLRERGLQRLSTEGGPHLLAQLIEHDLVDELDLTVSPVLAAGERPPFHDRSVLLGMRLAHLLEEDSSLFTRYLRERS